MTNIESIRFLLFGDVYDQTYPDSLLTDLIGTHGYNGAIIMCCLAELRKEEESPSSVAEHGGLSVSFERNERLRDILNYARTIGYTESETAPSGAILYGTSVAWEKKEFEV